MAYMGGEELVVLILSFLTIGSLAAYLILQVEKEELKREYLSLSGCQRWALWASIVLMLMLAGIVLRF